MPLGTREQIIRVGLVGPLPPPAGGMANQTRQLAQLLERDGFGVELVQMNAPYRPAMVGRVPVLRAIFRLVPYLVVLWRLAGRVDLIHLVSNSGWSWHLFSAPAIVVARMRRIPVVVNYRGGEAERFLSAQGRWVLPMLRMASAVAVPSGFLAEVFGRHRIKTTIVPNAVDLSRFSSEASDRPPLSAGPRILVARNLEKIYDIGTAIRAFDRVHGAIPGAHLDIAGSGPERAALEAEVARLGLQGAVEFHGRLNPDQMASLYRQAHFMLNPSTVDNTPNSILEAWASGVAVVSTRVGGVPHLVRDGVDALLVPPKDQKAMADAIVRMVDDPAVHRSLVQAGGERVREFTWEQIGPLWKTLYLRLAGRTGVMQPVVDSEIDA